MFMFLTAVRLNCERTKGRSLHTALHLTVLSIINESVSVFPVCRLIVNCIFPEPTVTSSNLLFCPINDQNPNIFNLL